ncbi:phosphoribosyltransferase family protein [Mesonia sp. K7]|uniref:phosphoribosyltransferase family protein n=1 Tax=Mesonia sp. K7 TaxID=2218606 RepID=UPI000DA90EB6|nr:phosphoribosyltransferase family protein [Mesonia sp. K7]PZD77867.1 phosphoribosyltransferase [Mesonia sp. K7]
MTKKNIILTNEQIVQKTRRIAFQIYENNTSEKEVILAGIENKGYLFAEKIALLLEEVSPLKAKLCKVKIDKKTPLSKISTSLTSEEYQNKSVIVIDDVLNTGSTLIYGIKHFLEVPIKKLQTAVLVDRNHKNYPVKVDYKGISLSTSLSETVKVNFGKNSKGELF